MKNREVMLCLIFPGIFFSDLEEPPPSPFFVPSPFLSPVPPVPLPTPVPSPSPKSVSSLLFNVEFLLLEVFKNG